MKKMIGKIALSLLLAFVGLFLGEALARLKSYGGGSTASFVLSSLQADILVLSGIIIFLILYVLGRQKEILKHQEEQKEAYRALQMLLESRAKDSAQMSIQNDSASDTPNHAERLEKCDES